MAKRHRIGKTKKCHHPGKYHLAKDGLAIVKPHPQAETCFAREQGYIVAKVEPAYKELGPSIVRAMNEGVHAYPASVARGVYDDVHKGTE